MTDMAPKAEITSADVDRVDAVDEPATGLPFIMLKSSVPPIPDRDPVAKAAPADMKAAPADMDRAPAENLEPSVGNVTIDPDDLAAASDPGSGPWEAVDASKAREAVSGLLAIRALIGFLANREEAEGDDFDNVWDLNDAGSAVECALSILATFAATEQAEADDAAAAAEADARALGLIKRMHLDAPTTPKEDAPVATPTKAELLKGLNDRLSKAQEEELPTGVIDLLNQIVAVMNAIDNVSTGADEAAASPADTGSDSAPDAPAAPDALADDSPVEEAAAAPAVPAPDAPPAEADQDGHASGTSATDEDGEDEIENAASQPNSGTDSTPEDGGTEPGLPGKPFAKGLDAPLTEDGLLQMLQDRHNAYMDAVKYHETRGGAVAYTGEGYGYTAPAKGPFAVQKAQDEPKVPVGLDHLIAEAVAKATEPLKKRISELEEMPTESGVLLSGHVPDTLGGGTNRGMGEGPDKAEAVLKAAAASGDSGKQTDAVVAAIAALHGSQRHV